MTTLWSDSTSRTCAVEHGPSESVGRRTNIDNRSHLGSKFFERLRSITFEFFPVAGGSPLVVDSSLLLQEALALPPNEFVFGWWASCAK